MDRKRTAILLIAVLIIAAALCACRHERVSVEASCEVNVYDPQTPDEIMAYLDDWQSFQNITVYDGSFAHQWVSERERGGVTVLPMLSDN